MNENKENKFDKRYIALFLLLALGLGMMSLSNKTVLDAVFGLTRAEKAIIILEDELTEYANSIKGNKTIKSYLQKEYSALYENDYVEIISYGPSYSSHEVLIQLKDEDIKIILINPCVVMSCGPTRDDVTLFTKNKEEIKDAISKYISRDEKQITENEFTKNLRLVTPFILDSVKIWSSIHEENINPLSPEKLEQIAKTKEFLGIHMMTVFMWCKENKSSMTCIDKDYLNYKVDEKEKTIIKN